MQSITKIKHLDESLSKQLKMIVKISNKPMQSKEIVQSDSIISLLNQTEKPCTSVN